MAIVTRCPACGTVFRVTPPQLQARGGSVRCGRCLTVFDGFKTLSMGPESEAAEEFPTSGSEADITVPTVPLPTGSKRTSLVPQVTAPANREDPAPPPAPVDERAPAQPPAGHAPPVPSSAPAFKLEAVSATELAAAAAGALRTRSDAATDAGDFGPPPEQLTLEDHLFLEESRDARARVVRLWAGGAVLLLVVLAAQVAYSYRGEIAARYPGLRPQLTRLCEMMGCGIYLPQRPQLISIEASDLQATDPARPALIQLTATVRNHATYDLGLPALDLVLTNSRDHTLARRIFQPREYLEAGRNPLAGLPARAEFTINLELDTTDLRPAGFRLELMAASPQ
jgi:predicted Zn finger-like uncharacterized protein